MRKLMVAGNWKLNMTIGDALLLAGEVARVSGDNHKVDMVLAPPFTAIKPVSDSLDNSLVKVAGQNVFWEESGAFTGEISPGMLKDAGARWVIIGHSERRQYFGETDERVNKKIKAALHAGLKVIACVGETLEEREAGKTFDVLDIQVEGALKGINAHELEKLVIAYEPVWAIGTGKSATPVEADDAHKYIREKVSRLYDAEKGGAMRVLYGGSVKPGNALELFQMENIDGGLIGGASLKGDDFNAIIDAGTKA